MPPAAAGNQPKASTSGAADLQAFGRFVGSIAGTLGANLLTVLPFCWLVSAAVFSAVAAGLHFSLSASSVLATVPSSWIFVAYILAGIACGTPLAVAIAVERSIDPIVQRFDGAAARLVEAIAADVRIEAPPSVAELASRLDGVVTEFRRHVGRVVSPLSPGGIAARLVTRLILRDVRRSLAGQIVMSLQAQPGAGRSIESLAPFIRSQITASIGVELKRKAMIGRVVSLVVWLGVFALSTLPIVFLT